MRLTLDFDITNSNAKALFNYIKTLDFVRVNESIEEENYTLTDLQKKALLERKRNHLTGKSKSFDWNEIKKELKK